MLLLFSDAASVAGHAVFQFRYIKTVG